MIATQPRRAPLSSIVAAALLVVFSATGLMAGGITFKLTGGLSLGGHSQLPKQLLAPAGSLTPTPTSTPSTSVAITQPFTLSLDVTPQSPHPGDQFQALLTASNAATHEPVAGLRCVLEDPEDGGAPLLSQWPAPAMTNAQGQAIWTITLPSLAPGTYAIGFTATGAHEYRYHGQISVSIT